MKGPQSYPQRDYNYIPAQFKETIKMCPHGKTIHRYLSLVINCLDFSITCPFCYTKERALLLIPVLTLNCRFYHSFLFFPHATHFQSGNTGERIIIRKVKFIYVYLCLFH